MLIINCLHCGNEFNAHRTTAQYCSNSCKTLACRQRRDTEERQKILDEQKRLSIEEANNAAIKWQADHDAERESAENQRIEIEIKLKKLSEQSRKAEKERKARELEKKVKEAEMKRLQNTLLVAGVAGAIIYAFQQSDKSANKPGDLMNMQPLKENASPGITDEQKNDGPKS